MTEHIIDMGQGLALYKVGVDEVSEQDVNARAMSPQMFERLAATIERDGRLESLPLMALNAEGKIEIISGHHRLTTPSQEPTRNSCCAKSSIRSKT